jgi:transketolase
MNPTLNTPLPAPQAFALQKRRAAYFNIAEVLPALPASLADEDVRFFEQIDLIYRTLCSILFNFVPTSGHPGGSISSGRIVESLIYGAMDYDFSSPDRDDADLISYAAGHKAMGLYAMWALRNELVRLGSKETGTGDLLADPRRQLRLEDLLGFRRNPTNETRLFKELKSKTLDGHPTCAIPFIRVATGASGVGVGASLGLALGAIDLYRDDPPNIHIVEGEGGMTPGRVHEALASASASRLRNAIVHLDWNQASIDSNRVCREDGTPGDYVQWNPAELFYLHDWNVIVVPDGFDFRQIAAAQRLALSLDTNQPTGIVYRTKKGWKYGIDGRESHGAGHKFCSEGYYASLKEFEETFQTSFPRFTGEASPNRVEENYFGTLMVIRDVLARNPFLTRTATQKISESRARLQKRNRQMRTGAPLLSALYESGSAQASETPAELRFAPGTSVTLREVLGKSLNILNQKSRGAILASSADLLGSTSVNQINKGFPAGFFNAVDNADSRLISVGGICEDAMGALMSGVSSFGHHIGVTSSYAAFIAALEHVAARLHGIGQQTRESVTGQPYHTWIMINAHAGVKTGEDGPTHADPQALQLLQECFPGKVLITLTPWDPQEVWPLLLAGLKQRPAILAPFVTRPSEKIVDREQLGLPPVECAARGIYAIRRADRSVRQYNGTVVLQGNGVAGIFVNEVLPRLEREGLNLDLFYITSVELFRLLPAEEQEKIFPESLMAHSMGITDFTLPTLHQWVRSGEGLKRSLHSFRGGHYLGSGSAAKVLEEAGIHAEGQFASILAHAAAVEKRNTKKLTGPKGVEARYDNEPSY